ncbi:hypothetical protein GO685_00180 [Wolbachia endosymbiont of Madathamugadia hiepei]|uniref:collagen-like triple helix repeat-containing protein n=1 Tax=Wolbachia endosymbiont of Madathamugadia hiepei TaxID=1241303 RepID=UPI00158B48CA|nr:collagen-like protein [Wolbachia endosymbiont of Madathamugadia hiepei]NUX00957.1 hypothetical protein [Wolbachia endosymbiont of Madathamugadia hiepei]
MLESSNIREVLPELEINDSVNLDKRKLNCLISKMHNADLAQVATELVTNKKDELGKAVLGTKDNENKEILVNSPILQEGVVKKLRENPESAKGSKGDKGEDGEDGEKGPQGDPGQDGESPSAGAVATQLLTDSNNKNTLVTEVAGNQGLQNAVATNLKGDKNFKDSVKGDPSQDGKSPSVDAVAAQLLTDEKKDTLVTEVARNESLQEAIAGNPDLRTSEAGESPSVSAVAVQLLTGANKNTLITEVASDEGLQEAIAGNQVPKDAVTTALNGDNDFHNIVKRATIDSSTNANNAK